MSISKQTPFFLLLASLLLAADTALASGGTFTWNGGGTDGNWTTGANWGGTAPTDPQNFLNFNGAARPTNTNNFSAGSPGYQIYFKSGANAFTLYGNGINFFDFGSVDPNIQNEGAFTNQTINFPITNANTHVSGSVRILNVNSNTGTAQGPLTFNGPIGTPSDSLARALNVSGTNTVTFNGVISDGGSSSAMGLTQLGTGTTVLTATNTYVGQTTVNAGTLTLNGGSTAAGSFVKVNTGGALSVFASGKIYGNVQIATNTTATQNASISGTNAGNLQIDPASMNVTPQNAIYTTPASGFVQMNLSASIASGGFITNQGVLNLTGNSALTLGTLIGPGSDAAGNLGGILDNNTNSKTLTLGNGSAFAYYKPAGGIPGTTLQIVGNGAAFIKWFGYNDGTGIAPYTNTLNGGTWTIANAGQNSSACHYIGVCNVSNSAAVSVTNNVNFVHGTWNVVSNSSLTFFQSGKSLQSLHLSSNFGLNLNVNNTASLFVGGNGLILGFATGTGTANTAAENNNLNIPGGLAYITNSLTVGGGADNQAAETNTVTLSAGKLIVSGTLSVGSANNIITNASPWNPVAPVNIFNWAGGQLTAATITTSNGLVIQGVTNTSTAFYVTNPAVFNSGNISSTTLTNNAGTLAPGDVGLSGKTTINGSYVQTSGGTLDIDLNGTTAATTFQTASAYDVLTVTKTAALAGSLIVRTNGAATITATTGFTILTTAANGLSGTFNNLYNNRVALTGANGGSFRIVFNTASLVLTNYAALAASFTPVSGSSPAPFTQTFDGSASVGAITNYTWTFTDNATMTNVVNSASATTDFTFTNAGSYSVQLIVTAVDGTKATNSSAVGAFTATGNPTLAWTGSASANWNTTDQNWTNLTAGGLTTAYLDADPVIFNEAGSVHPVVNLATTVLPASVNFSNSATTYTLQGAGKISGTTALKKSLGGTTIIATTNDFSGGTTITGGTLQLGDGATASGTLGGGTVVNNSLLAFNPAGAATFTNSVSGSGAVVVRNSAVTLSAANSFSGGTTVSNGATLSIAADNNLGFGGGLNLNNGTLATTGSFTLSNRTVTLGAGNGTFLPANTLTITNALTGAGGLTMGGAGALVLSAVNSYGGSTVVSSGVLQIGSGGTSGALPGGISLAGGSVTYSRTDSFSPAGMIVGSSSVSSVTNVSTTAANTNSLTFADGINYFGTVRNSAAGTLALNASANCTNNLAGNFVNSSGALQLNGGSWFVTNNLSPAGSSVSLNGATVVAGGGMASYGATNLSINSGTLLVNGGARFSTVLSNANFNITGGSLVISNTSFGLRLGNSSANNAAQGGYVQFTGVQSGGSILVTSNSDSAFSLGGYGPVASAQNVSYTLAGGTLTVPFGGGSGNGIWLGADSNLLATTTFTLTGSGKAIVYNVKGAQGASSGAKQFFNFSGGTLVAFNIDASNLQSSNAPGAFGTLFNNGGTLAPGDSGTPGKTTITGNLTNYSGALAIDLGGNVQATAFQNGLTNYDYVSVTGATLLGGSLNVSLINGLSPAATDSFTILDSAGGVSGTFTNLFASNRVAVVGNPNVSFQVLVTATSVILTNLIQNAPTVTVSPNSTNTVYGKSILLTANVGGVSPFVYQWFDNNTNAIANATNGTLNLAAPSVAASGNYTVIVTNSFGRATNLAAVIITPAALSITAGNASKNYGQTLTFAGTEFTSSGLTNGDSVTSVALTSAGATNTATVAGSTYAIVPSAATGSGLNNYIITYNNGTLTVNPASTSVGLSSTKNPSGYKEAIFFSATLPVDATGNVVFSSTNGLISTSSLSGGSASSHSITNLPRGTNLIKVSYSGDGNYFGSTNIFNQIVTNHPPVATDATYTRGAAVNTYKIAVSNLLASASDIDSDTLSLVSAGGSTNGALVMIGGNYVLYYNTNAVADQFSYTVTDANGGTNSATVTINIDTTPLFGQSQIATVSGGMATLNFAGIPGYSYSVQRSTNLVDWTALLTTNAPVGGAFIFTDSSAPTPSAFYRLKYNP